MGDVAVIHMDLMSKGGGEAVCMNVLEALQDDHNVTLMTLTDPELEALNAYFDTSVDVDAITVEKAGRLAPWLHDRYGIKYYILQNALLGKYASRHTDEFDLLVSTINELGLNAEAIQYIHFPFDWTVSLDNRKEIFHPSVEEDSLYEKLCTRVADVSLSDIQSSTLLANSQWTADVVEDAYGTQPHIVYPPVDTSGFDDVPWAEREDGFVTVGRIERSKRIHRLIDIIDGVRDRGHDQHLHVVGPTVDEEYRAELETMVERREYVTIDGELPREELVERICTHRYGIHGKQYEHFGMAVAELVAGGVVPFVPESGGQCDIVNNQSELTYASVEEAVDNIDAVISNRRRQRELRQFPGEVERRFGCKRFAREFKTIVAEVLDKPTGGTSRPTLRASPEPSGSND